MKGIKRNLVLLAVITILALLLVVLAGCSGRNEVKTTEAAYRIEQLSSGVIRVVGDKVDYAMDQRGYGLALGQAIQEIANQYDIVEITPINYYIGFGSVTKELIIRVKPKQ